MFCTSHSIGSYSTVCCERCIAIDRIPLISRGGLTTTAVYSYCSTQTSLHVTSRASRVDHLRYTIAVDFTKASNPTCVALTRSIIKLGDRYVPRSWAPGRSFPSPQQCRDPGRR
jgi:hypothetical protein